jgi:hypothetical protein
MGTVYTLTLRQLTSRGRLVIMIALAAMPVAIAAAMLRSPHATTIGRFELSILSAMLAGSIAPLVVLATSAAAFGNELEDRTLANLTLSPTPRWRIALPKLLATISVAGPFIAASACATAYIAFLGDTRAVMATTLAALAGVAMYASLFTWLGLVSGQAIGIGLLYIVLWEGFFAGYISGVRLFSIRHYSVTLMHVLDARRFAGIDTLNPKAAVVLSALVVGGFLWLTIRKLEGMDVP